MAQPEQSLALYCRNTDCRLHYLQPVPDTRPLATGLASDSRLGVITVGGDLLMCLSILREQDKVKTDPEHYLPWNYLEHSAT